MLDRKKKQCLLMRQGFSLFTQLEYEFASKEPWRFNSKEIEGMFKYVRSDSFLSLYLDQQTEYLNFLVSLQDDIHFSIAKALAEVSFISSIYFQRLFKRWLDFSIEYPGCKVYLHTICARATDEVYLDCFQLIKISSLELSEKEYIALELLAHWRKFNRNCDSILYLSNSVMCKARRPLYATNILVEDISCPRSLQNNPSSVEEVFDQNECGVSSFLPLSPKDAESTTADSSQQLPIDCGFDIPEFQFLPHDVSSNVLSQVDDVKVEEAECIVLTSDSITAANDSKNLVEQALLITFCTEPDLQKLKSLLGSFNTFLPKRFFGDVPAGMKEVIALIDNNAPTPKVLYTLREVAKNRTGQNIWHTRQEKTIQAYKAINEFFSGDLQEKNMADLLTTLSNIITPQDPMIEPVLTEVSL
ncbi:MAG: hypothetical protein LRY69_01195 [Gammaproteobacteria bacterium]|nr:hypothetical protein [Gammaproteobacteria bacterium]